ncbi:MAG: undecaprenyl-diphosphatase [Caedibacter sp. 38-128]|nr:undecaprenyl-diphosphate phosphatase [Holosporales bacterium]OJX03505.1 MAG: undecaprenyl-diphosphatase [Caedibacter sp. 38-128]
MSLYQIVILAIIQGATEFLPISSTGHLILVPHIFHWLPQGLELDVAMHVGTLLAVVLYFWRDILGLLQGFFLILRGEKTLEGKMALYIILATIPAIIGGLILSSVGMDVLRTVTIVGWMSIVYGVLLFVIDRKVSPTQTLQDMTWKKAFFVGCAQALALIPGTSRSGACMTMARFLGFSRVDSARFAFLLSIPAILGAATLTGYKMQQEGQSLLTQEILLGAVIAAISGLIAIRFMMVWLQKASFTPFVVYRIILGIFLLMIA